MARFAIHLGLVLVALLVVSGSARLLVEEDVVEPKSNFQESKFKGLKPHHSKPKLPSLPPKPEFPKPTLPSFTLPGCSPPPPTDASTPSSYTPTYSPPPSTYSYPPPPSTYSSPPPPSTGY